MREHQILYFSTSRDHIRAFNAWATQEAAGRPVCWLEDDDPNPLAIDLPRVIKEHQTKDQLYVIIDYLSILKDIKPGIDGDKPEMVKYEEMASMIRRTILQFPEVDFLFDQSGVPDETITGVEFLLEEDRSNPFAGNFIAQGFHSFRKENGFVLASLDYDNLFDGTNLRYAIKKKYYNDLELEIKEGNFQKIQEKRRDSLAVVIDDEASQCRFNGYAMYTLGYRVIPVLTARMLLMVNHCVNSGQMKPDVIIRDFDLQFPDASKKKDYDEKTTPPRFKDVITWTDDWKLNKSDVDVPLKAYEGKQKNEYGEVIPANVIDAIRNYRFFKDNEFATCRWIIPPVEDESNPFWGPKLRGAPSYVISNGHDMMHINHASVKRVLKKNWLELQGIEKPVSGLYFPFYRLLGKDGKPCFKNHFESTRYTIDNVMYYGINKKRKQHNHGAPVDIYETASEMLDRAEKYYEDNRLIKSAVVAQEAIELLNGFHYQMMIRAYQIKTKAENAIAMDVIGADEKQLVLDAMERIKIIKEDVCRMVYPLNKGEGHSIFKDFIIQMHRRKKEHELLIHIFSDCRATCRDNEYFNVEAVFIREMAHLDSHDLGLDDFIRYFKHRKFMKALDKLESASVNK